METTFLFLSLKGHICFISPGIPVHNSPLKFPIIGALYLIAWLDLSLKPWLRFHSWFNRFQGDHISTAAFFPENFWQGGNTYSCYLCYTYFFLYDYGINSHPWLRTELKDPESVPP